MPDWLTIAAGIVLVPLSIASIHTSVTKPPRHSGAWPAYVMVDLAMIVAAIRMLGLA